MYSFYWLILKNKNWIGFLDRAEKNVRYNYEKQTLRNLFPCWCCRFALVIIALLRKKIRLIFL